MNTDNNNQADNVQSTKDTEAVADTISIPKTDYEKLNQDLGSLKRELKDLRKSKDEPREDKSDKTSDSKSSDKVLERLEKLALRNANVTHEDDVTLARQTAKKWNMDLEDVLLDSDFKVKLERQQTDRTNVAATSNIKGNGNVGSQAKNTPEYWIAKGTPPSREDVPDRATRAKIARAFIGAQKNSKKFYND